MRKDDIRQRLHRAILRSPSRGKIRRISLFGSYLHGHPKEGSDLDLLIEISGPMGLFEFVGLKQFLEEQVGMPIDLVEPEALSKYIRDDVLREAEPLYQE